MRWLFSWTLYWIGDLVYHLFGWSFDDHGIGWVFYTVYETLMEWSDYVQGDGCGPWKLWYR